MSARPGVGSRVVTLNRKATYLQRAITILERSWANIVQTFSPSIESALEIAGGVHHVTEQPSKPVEVEV
ncbi:MAG: hypothetical protein IPH35_13760 [Rhodoferax sp.]|nr:hypothetical protein [Rhodoferax sp.]